MEPPVRQSPTPGGDQASSRPRSLFDNPHPSERAAGLPARKSLLLGVPVAGRLAWASLGRGRLCADGHALLLEQEDSEIEIPAAAFACLLLEPGVSVTHEAAKLCAHNGAAMFWVGEEATRLYCASAPRHDPRRIIAQAGLHLDMPARIEAARRIHVLMFGKEAPPSHSLEKLRGIEGSAVRAWYPAQAAKHGLVWDGRGGGSKLQQAISFATSCLYALAEVAILVLGYSPAIGVMHSGDERSFAYDLADTVKFSVVIPAVMGHVAAGGKADFATIRRLCRDEFGRVGLLDVLIKNADFVVLGQEADEGAE